uniref:Variant surface glycoprotein 1125.5789 n=1 Tax=Trypanosoma brucei TaxID=5691 RepID=A0A1J0RCZ7_9TRYP|nr:variant surface glycoprotein 1125.5789 [Trypanosoma brucei]
MAGASASATHGCLGTDETGSNPVKGNTGLASLKANCGILKAGLTRTTATDPAFTKNGFTSDKQGGAVAPTATPGTTGECSFTETSNAFHGLNPAGGQALNQDFKMAAGFFKTSATGLTMQATNNLKTPDRKPTRLLAAFQAHITTNRARDELQQTDLNKIKLTEVFKQAMRQIVLKAETATTFESPDQFSENSKAKIDNEEIPKGISGDENNPKPLGTISDIAQLYRIFFHYKDFNTKALESKISELEKN